ncbi:MAG: ABC transporter permease [Sulfolobales archaeon]|nr:ABC transporter permease [Sulfolobales archaeon]MDW8082906.1 ABC transporter permease [Sulfolobales archaeon]
MSFSRLLKKEVLSVLKSPAFIVSILFLVVYFVVLGRVIGTATEQVIRGALEAPVGVIVEDENTLTEKLLYLANVTLKGRLVLVKTVEEGLSVFRTVVLVPEGFGDSLFRPGAITYVQGYISLDRVFGLQQTEAMLVSSVASVFTEVLRYLVAVESGIDVGAFSRSVTARVEVRVGERVIDFNVLSALSTSAMMFTVLIGILAMMTLIFSAQAVASEKEEKAFEMLLTLPIGRATIAIAKITGAVAISILTALVYFFGFSYVLSSPISQSEQASGTVTTLSLWDVVRYLGSDGVLLLAASLGLVLLFSGALGILIGALVSDTKIAGAVTGPIGAVLYVGLIAVQFIGIPLSTGPLALGAMVYGLPLAVVIAYVVGEKILALLAIGVSVAVTMIPLVVVVRVFESEKILLGIVIRRAKKK